MKRTITILFLVLALSLAAALPALAQAPNFGEAIYADGRAWGTKGLGELPPPNDSNQQSFDLLFNFSNGAAGQLAVAEAGPGNPAYNGGRWDAHSATWTEAGLAAYGGAPPVLTSYAQVLEQQALGYLELASANHYFLCPLLPVK